ncbi:SP_1767 family glycosyltransferase [Holdemanella porci]|uniref:SP_1767 family glycosyltransferase n=1 Tax=Holdemanella porci TaxID=2652276 RepID=UPI003F933C3B
MRIHVTNVYGFSIRSTVLQSQHEVVDILKDLCDSEIGLFRYYNEEEPKNELSSRLDGVIARLNAGDVVIFQSPTWNGVDWDNALVDKIKLYGGRVVFFIQDVPPIQFENNYFLMPYFIDMYNKAEVVVVPSEKMYQRLVEEGLTVKKYVVQKMWDFNVHMDLHTPSFEKKLYFLGDVSRFPFFQNWQFNTPLHVFGNHKPDYDYSKVHFGGWLNKTELLLELSKGGFGLVWGNQENPKDEPDYYKMNCSYKLASYLSAGIPVIVPDYLSNADFVKENNIGFVVSSLEEADQVIQECSEEKYSEIVSNVKKVQYLINNGYFTKKLFVDSLMKLNSNEDNELNIKVLGILDTLNYIMAHNSSVARFGDGEMDIITGHSIPYQDYDENLANELKEIISSESNESLVVCLSDVFERLDRYNQSAVDFWKQHLNNNYIYYKSLCKAPWYGSTFISRPYMDLVDKSLSNMYFKNIKNLWDKRDILIVEGVNSRSGVGNDLFDNANSVERIICPSKNAYSKINEIQLLIERYAENKLVLLILGPTAKVLAKRLSIKKIQAIDMGHIDSEYEWFKMKATTKVKLDHKHTAEHNFDENITFIEDDAYNSQIVERIG